MKRYFMLLAILWVGPALADRIFVDGFDPPHIDPQFPIVDGEFQLPDEPASNQLAWVLSELQTGENTTLAEVQAHFDPTFDAAAMQTFMNDLRGYFPDARVIDVVGVTPVALTAVIDSPDQAPPHGWLLLNARYTGDNLIRYFGVYNIGDTVVYPVDQNLDLTQAADKFVTLSANPGLVVARIRGNQVCEVVTGRNEATLRATASIFKIWVLGSVAQAVAGGSIRVEDLIPLVASELAPGSEIINEPLGTMFPVEDMATLMMGISDNTATDHMHALVGRDAIEQTVSDFGHSAPDVLRPFLGISEQFHLFYSFPLSTALAYVNGTEAYQEQFLHDQIEPLGSIVGDPYTYSNFDIFLNGTWQASPMDVCRAFAHLRSLPQGSDAITMVDRALGAQAAQPNVRAHWDRVWYKGGSLSRTTGDYDVLTHAWMLENAGEDPWVVVAMSNQLGGGIEEYQVQSVTGRILELLANM